MTATAPSSSGELKNLGYEIFISLLSILSVINLALVWLPGMSEPSKQVVVIFQAALTIIFFADFIYRLTTTQSKSQYFFKNWGWPYRRCRPSRITSHRKERSPGLPSKLGAQACGYVSY